MIGEPRVVVRKEASVPTDIKEFISFWIENSIHARPIMGQGGSSQDSTDLARRLLAAAEELGLSEKDIADEIGNPEEYLRQKLVAANTLEQKRQK